MRQPSEQSPDPGVTRFAQRMRRLDDRIRRWPPNRWAASGRAGRARADAAYELATELAYLARQAGNGAPDVQLPRVQAHAIADQLAVLAAEVTGAPEAAAVAEAAAAALERAEQEL